MTGPAFLGRFELDGRTISDASFADHASRAGFAQSQAFGTYALARQQESDLPPRAPYAPIMAIDAVIDNRAELNQALAARSTDVGSTDEDLVRAAVAAWGAVAPQRLIGDFAFVAIYPNEQRLLLARDHIGARPLYYALRGQTVLFASTIAAIVACRDFDWSVSDAVVAEYLANPLMPLSRSFYAHIQKAPPGSVVHIECDRIQVSRWWPEPSSGVQKEKDPRAYITSCRAILERAIADRIPAKGKIAAHLSGGVDSTAVATLAQRELVKQGRTLRAAYAWPPAVSDAWPDMGARDERRRIAGHARKEAMPICFSESGGDAAEFLRLIDRRMDLEGEADLADELPVLRRARRDDVTLMLSGWGGDEAFSAMGHGYLVHLLLSGQLSRARRFARRMIGSPRDTKALAALMQRDILRPLLPDWLYRQFDPARHYFPDNCFLSESLSRAHPDIVANRRQSVRITANPRENLKRLISAGHLTMRMETWAVWSAEHGLRYRYPLTDRRLLEFILNAPPEIVFLDDKPRGLALATVEDVLPAGAGKHDIANEAFRLTKRNAAWKALAARVRDGFYDGDCPWLDMEAFRTRASVPRQQADQRTTLQFVELFAAARIWTIYKAHSA